MVAAMMVVAARLVVAAMMVVAEVELDRQSTLRYTNIRN